MDETYETFEDYDRVKQECLDITFMETTGEANSMTLELLNLMTSDDDKRLQMVMKYCASQAGLAEDLFTLRARLYQVMYTM
jgi:hypothetical protein